MPRIDFGTFRRLHPIDRDWGFNRGLPIDRYYIESFLEDHALDIRGRTLEIANDAYTRKFGGARVVKSDVLSDEANGDRVTIVSDLAEGKAIPSDTFDCVICTQTLHLIYDLTGAISTLHRVLKPGGVLLATLPGITQVSPQDMERTGDYWRVTPATAERLTRPLFGPGNSSIYSYGNVLAASSFLYGVASEELTHPELNHTDRNYPVVVAIRAVK